MDLKNLKIKDMDVNELTKELPEKFRKMVIVINSSFWEEAGYKNPKNFHWGALYEFISGHPFNWYRSKYEEFKENGKKYVNAIQVPSNYVGKNITFSTKLYHISSDEVLNFYKEIQNEGYFDKYKNILYTLLDDKFKEYEGLLNNTLVEFKEKMLNEEITYTKK